MHALCTAVYRVDTHGSVLNFIADGVYRTLKFLSVTDNIRIWDIDLTVLEQCTLLESLDISNTGIELHLPLVLQRCTNLRTLKMDGLYVTDAILCAVVQHCAHMQCISIVDCYEHTKAGILALAKHAQSLEVIVVGEHDPVLNELAIELMREKFPKLRIKLPPKRETWFVNGSDSSSPVPSFGYEGYHWDDQ